MFYANPCHYSIEPNVFSEYTADNYADFFALRDRVDIFVQTGSDVVGHHLLEFITQESISAVVILKIDIYISRSFLGKHT